MMTAAAKLCTERAAAAEAFSSDGTLTRTVHDSAVEVETICATELSQECVQDTALSSRRGCPYKVRSLAALLHVPSVEACIRMGYWWNRPYCASAVQSSTVLHLVNATTGKPTLLPVFDKYRIATFTSATVWPIRSIPADATVPLVIAIEPTDSVPPDAHQCSPALQACKVSYFAQNATHTRDSTTGGILWPGITLGYERMDHRSQAYFEDTPWHAKRNMAVWRGALHTCWALEGACSSRDMLGRSDLPRSHASRLVAWRRLHSSPLFDFAFGNELKYLGRARQQEAEAGISRFFPQRSGNTSHDLSRVFEEVRSEARQLCRHPNISMCKGKRPASLSPAEQSKYKLILSIDGASYPSSLSWVQISSSTVLAPPSAYDTHADVGMLPWVHFIPTKLDFSDAEDKVRWCLEHDRECEAIGAAGRAHMMRSFEEEPFPLGPRIATSQHSGKRRSLRPSSFERRVGELIVSHLVANARKC